MELQIRKAFACSSEEENRGREGMRLNLGCGNDYLEGYINIDKKESLKTDMRLDVFKRLPFESNSVDEIIAKFVLEDSENIIKTLREWHRILKIGGTLKITVPYAYGCYAFVNPEHKHCFSWNTFLYFTNKTKYSYFYDFHFKIKKRKFIMLGWFKHFQIIAQLVTKFAGFYERFLKGIFSVDAIYCELEKGDSVKECEARISSLKHIKAVIDMNLKARYEELKEAKKEARK